MFGEITIFRYDLCVYTATVRVL